MIRVAFQTGCTGVTRREPLKPYRSGSRPTHRHVRVTGSLTIGFYPEEMEAMRKAADTISDNISAFIREAAVAKAKQAK